MSDFDQLGAGLREQLHACVADLQPSARLFAAVDALPSAPRSRWAFRGRLSRRRLTFAVPIPIAAIAAGAVVLFGSSGVSTSVAGGIIVLRDGAVRITPTETNDPAAANALLRRHHIHDIVAVPMTASCTNHNATYMLGYEPNGPGRAPLETLTPNSGTAGYTTVIGSKQISRHNELTAIGRFKGTIPACVSSHGTGLGFGNALPGNRKFFKHRQRSR